jgi:2-polyprenyl-3-methyl-5-hydroxy-6-metoxy-1,4-benzoquinol methylase
MPNYGDPRYWDKRYREHAGTVFDWLEDFQTLRPIFTDHLPDKTVKIIMIGCGNAPLSEDMYKEGYENILNVDISAVVIEQMRERNRESCPKMTYEVMDCTEMSSLADH